MQSLDVLIFNLLYSESGESVHEEFKNHVGQLSPRVGRQPDFGGPVIGQQRLVETSLSFSLLKVASPRAGARRAILGETGSSPVPRSKPHLYLLVPLSLVSDPCCRRAGADTAAGAEGAAGRGRRGVRSAAGH